MATVETNTGKKLIFVPRNWGVRYTNIKGEEVFISLSAPEEYLFKYNDGREVICTVQSVLRDNDDEKGVHKTTIQPAFIMTPGYWEVIRKGTENDQIDLDDIVEIVNLKSRYTRAQRPSKDIVEQAETTYTFAFDVDGYDSRYRITVGKGEFVSLSVKDPYKEGARKTLYGHIIGVDDDDNIHMVRYLSNKGVRFERPDYKIAIADLLGIYRYELEFVTAEEAQKQKDEKAAEAEAAATDECADCTVPSTDESSVEDTEGEKVDVCGCDTPCEDCDCQA